MGKAVQHGVPGGNAGHGPAVIFLVQEEAGLLAVFKIDVVIHAVLADLCLGGVGVGLTGQLEPALVLLQPLLGAEGFVIPLIDAVNGLAVGPQDFRQDGEENGLELFHPRAQGLGDEDIVEAVYRQARKLVGLPKDDPAGGKIGGLQHGLAVGPGVLHPAAPEAGVKGIVGVAGDEPHPDLAVVGDKARAEVSALGADHIGQGTVFRERLRRGGNIVFVHPGVAAHQQALGVFVDLVDGISAFFHSIDLFIILKNCARISKNEMGETTMEIERKWMVNGWPEQPLPLKEEFAMRQGYISVRPTVRIREEALTGGETKYILCFKSGSGLAREEIEREIDKELFTRLEEKIIGKPLIPKLRRSYQLPDGMVLEVNHVDEGQPTEFWYAEVEYPTVEAARSWRPEAVGLAAYLNDDVTDQPGQSMGAYWEQTRT